MDLEGKLTWLVNRRWKRILIVLTGIVWLPIALLIGSICMIASMIWEGDIGDLMRWTWKGSADNV